MASAASLSYLASWIATNQKAPLVNQKVSSGNQKAALEGKYQKASFKGASERLLSRVCMYVKLFPGATFRSYNQVAEVVYNVHNL